MMKKFIALAALSLALAACSKNETEEQLLPVESKGITLTATLDPKDAPIKALTDNGDGKLTASWAVNEKLAILYRVSNVDKYTEAEVKSVDAVTGAATIEFTVVDATPDGTACTVIYPAAITNLTPLWFDGGKARFLSYLDHLARRDPDENSDAQMIANQGGTFSPELDIRFGTGVITPSDPVIGLVLEGPLAPKYAIFKFTLQTGEGAPISARSLAVTIGTDGFVATPTASTGEYYVALPRTSGKAMTISAINDTGNSSYRFFRANVTFEAGKYYRSTLKMTPQSEAADYVRMGDGLRWAVKNVGAAKPEDCGDYFAWGEVEPYYKAGHACDDPFADENWKEGKSAGYDWPSYRWANGAYNKLTKYCNDSSYGNDGFTDGLTNLESADDAATYNMGTDWRIPTEEEYDAFRNKNDFTGVWVKNFNGSGNNGCLVISKKSGFEGNCLFFPAAGIRYQNFIRSPETGFYYTSYPNMWSGAFYFSFGDYDGGRTYFERMSRYRCEGLSVRGVQKVEEAVLTISEFPDYGDGGDDPLNP